MPFCQGFLEKSFQSGVYWDFCSALFTTLRGFLLPVSQGVLDISSQDFLSLM